MSNRELSKGVDSYRRKSYQLYLRVESIKKITNPSYVVDKSFDSYKKSKFYGLRNLSYSQYLKENIVGAIDYSEYICENIDKSITYSDYLAEQCVIQTANISYTQYIAEKI